MYLSLLFIKWAAIIVANLFWEGKKLICVSLLEQCRVSSECSILILLCLYPQKIWSIVFFNVFVFYINSIVLSLSLCHLLFSLSMKYVLVWYLVAWKEIYLILCNCCILFHGWLYLNLFTVSLLMEIKIVCNSALSKLMWVCLWTIYEKWKNTFTKYGFDTGRWGVKIQCALYKFQDA